MSERGGSGSAATPTDIVRIVDEWEAERKNI